LGGSRELPSMTAGAVFNGPSLEPAAPTGLPKGFSRRFVVAVS
jgi:hypothetical protein